jgi:hypothetical protein
MVDPRVMEKIQEERKRQATPVKVEQKGALRNSQRLPQRRNLDLP